MSGDPFVFWIQIFFIAVGVFLGFSILYGLFTGKFKGKSHQDSLENLAKYLDGNLHFHSDTYSSFNKSSYIDFQYNGIPCKYVEEVSRSGNRSHFSNQLIFKISAGFFIKFQPNIGNSPVVNWTNKKMGLPSNTIDMSGMPKLYKDLRIFSDNDQKAREFLMNVEIANILSEYKVKSMLGWSHIYVHPEGDNLILNFFEKIHPTVDEIIRDPEKIKIHLDRMYLLAQYLIKNR